MEQTFMQRMDEPWGYERFWAYMADAAGKMLHIDRGYKWSRLGQNQHVALRHGHGPA